MIKILVAEDEAFILRNICKMIQGKALQEQIEGFMTAC